MKCFYIDRNGESLYLSPRRGRDVWVGPFHASALPTTRAIYGLVYIDALTWCADRGTDEHVQ